MQGELQIALRERRVDVGHLRRPPAAVPNHYRASAILALRDYALEAAIFHRMILHLHGQPLHRRVEGWPVRDGPGEQDALPLEAKIVVEMRGLVLLNDVGELSARRALRLGLARRFGRGVKTSFLFVFLEAHGISLSPPIFSAV